MIPWISTKDQSPEAGKKIILKLSDGRCCSALVTETGGIELDYIDNVDLLFSMFAEAHFIYIDE